MAKVLLFMFAVLVATVAADSSYCIACGGTMTPFASYTNPSGNPSITVAGKYWPLWGDPLNSQGRGCYWILDGTTQGGVSNGGKLNYYTSSCGSGASAGNCFITPSPNGYTQWSKALPDTALAADCKNLNGSGPAWLWFPFSSLQDVRCACSNVVYGSRTEVARRYHVSEDEFKLIPEEKLPEAKLAASKVQARSANVTARTNCYQSLICDPHSGANCPNCNGCTDHNDIPCTSISGSTQNCPGYAGSPWTTSSCPLIEGPTCSICNSAHQGCQGTYAQSLPHGCTDDHIPCLECHVINLNDGSQICGTHMSGTDGYANGRCYCGGCYPNLDWSMASAPRMISICAPWGGDIKTRQCVTGYNGGQCQPASVADCLAGNAIPPRTADCGDVQSCSGEICGYNLDAWDTSYGWTQTSAVDGTSFDPTSAGSGGANTVSGGAVNTVSGGAVNTVSGGAAVTASSPGSYPFQYRFEYEQNVERREKRRLDRHE